MLKGLYVALAAFLVVLIVGASGYGVYSVYYAASPSQSPTPTVSPTSTASPASTVSPTSTASPTSTVSPTSTASPTIKPKTAATPTPAPTSVTITDYNDDTVTLQLPVERIVVLNGGLGEILCALGGEDKIVARVDSFIFPPSIEDVESLGTAKTFSTEALLSLTPDLVIADTMVSDADIAAIENAGVPVIVETTGSLSRVETIITNFGLILGDSATATQLLADINYYTNLVETRIADANLAETEKTTAFIEWTSAGRGRANGTAQDALLTSAGGLNVLSSSSVTTPNVSEEFLLEANPAIIIKLVSTSSDSSTYQTVYDEIMSRTSLTGVTAITSERVHVIYYYLTSGLQYPFGELYFAKWSYPDLFADISVDTLHAQFVQKYFGITLTGTWVYPGGS